MRGTSQVSNEGVWVRLDAAALTQEAGRAAVVPPPTLHHTVQTCRDTLVISLLSYATDQILEEDFTAASITSRPVCLYTGKTKEGRSQRNGVLHSDGVYFVAVRRGSPITACPSRTWVPLSGRARGSADFARGNFRAAVSARDVDLSVCTGTLAAGRRTAAFWDLNGRFFGDDWTAPFSTWVCVSSDRRGEPFSICSRLIAAI